MRAVFRNLQAPSNSPQLAQNIDLGGINNAAVKLHSAAVLNVKNPIDSINQSCQVLKLLGSYVHSLNAFADTNESRSADDIKSLFAILDKAILEDKLPSTNAKQFLTLFHNCYTEEQRKIPIFFKLIENIIEITRYGRELPAPTVYLDRSPSNRETYRTLQNRIESLKEQAFDTDNAREKENLEAQIGRVNATIKALVDKTTDVRLEEIVELRKSLYINIAPNASFVENLLKSSNSIANAISALLSGKTNQLSVEIVVLGNGEKSPLSSKTKIINISYQSETEQATLISTLINYYLLARTMLADYYSNQNNSGNKDSQLRQNIGRLLATILPGDRGRGFLGNTEHIAIQTRIIDLAFAPVLSKDTNAETIGNKLMPAALDPENYSMLEEIFSKLFYGSSEELEDLKKLAKNTPIQSNLENLYALKVHLKNEDFPRLTVELNSLIQKCPNSYYDKLCFAYAISALLSDKKICKRLKGRIHKKKELFEDLDELRQDNRKGVPAAINILKQRLVTLLERNLDDYLGQRETVKKFKNFIERHIFLIRNPQRYENLDPNNVFINSFIIEGPPGVGKTELVSAAATHYKIATLFISRNEILAALKAKYTKIVVPKSKTLADLLPAQDEEDATVFSQHLSEFIKEKREELDKALREGGLEVGMLVFDEMEADFINRKSELVTALDIQRINIMLREIEVEMKKSPHILFAGLTNFMDLVDPAAARFGRFGGQVFKVKFVDKDSAIDLLTHTFESLDLNIEELLKTENMPNLIYECLGLTPLPIINGITNAYITSQHYGNAKTSSEELIAFFTESLAELREGLRQTIGERPEKNKWINDLPDAA